MSPKLMGEFKFQHVIPGKSKQTVFQGLMRWLEIEDAWITQKDDPNNIEAIHGHVLVLGVASRDAKKTLNFHLSDFEDGVEITLVMIPSKAYFDEMEGGKSVITNNWGRLADEIWASIEGSQLAREVQPPNWILKDQLENVKRVARNRIVIYSTLEALLLIGAFYLDPPGNIVRDAIGTVWFLIVMAFIILILPWLINVVIYSNSRRTLKRLKRKEDRGLI